MPPLRGESNHAMEAGLYGHNTAQGDAIFGRSIEVPPGGLSGRGVVGVAKTAAGVEGQSESGAGVWGQSKGAEGVIGQTQSLQQAAVAGIHLNTNPATQGAGIYGEHKGTGPAGFFKGDVIVTGDVKLVNADCAEDFEIANAEIVEPGMIMVIGAKGALCQSERAYDKRVVGVVSGAGSLRPAIILDKQQSTMSRKPIALLGKVYCKVDATYAAIEEGDLLTTSPTPGHAMKAQDPQKAYGAILGKALESLNSGQGLIPILVALQ